MIRNHGLPASLGGHGRCDTLKRRRKGITKKRGKREQEEACLELDDRMRKGGRLRRTGKGSKSAVSQRDMAFTGWGRGA